MQPVYGNMLQSPRTLHASPEEIAGTLATAINTGARQR